MNVSKRSPEERFWSYVQWQGKTEDDCWLWLGALTKERGHRSSGYASFTVRRNGRQKTYYGHRFAYEWAYGEIPDGQMVRHLCEGKYAPGDLTCRRCCNPKHLALGDSHDNYNDSLQAGRAGYGPIKIVYGEEHPRHKFTTEVVHGMRDYFDMYARQMGIENCLSVLCAHYGASRSQTRAIVRRKYWKHV